MTNKVILKSITLIIFILGLAACQGQEGGIALKGTETDNPTLHSDTYSELVSASADTNTKSSLPGDNKGESRKVDVWNSNEDNKEGFVKFDLNQFPLGTSVKKATLRLWVSQVKDQGIVEIHAVSGVWDESELNFENALGLRTQFLNQVFVSDSDEGQFVEVDVTAAVQGWVSGRTQNDGFALIGSGANGPVRIDFFSKEEPQKAMSLEIQAQSE